MLGSAGGGLSGSAIKPIALRAIHDVHVAHPELPILGTGGITTGLDAVESLLAGASAVGVGTVTFAEPRAALRILDELCTWCARHGVRVVARAHGSDARSRHGSNVVSATRDRLVLALDVDDLAAARTLAARLAPWFATVKIGFELYAAAGPAAFDALHADGFRIFADLKLHDIPTTVARAARVHGRRGVELLNFHAAGGDDDAPRRRRRRTAKVRTRQGSPHRSLWE